jgi:hypothetical protein
VRVGIWNVQWRSWNGAAGMTMAQRLWSHDPEVVCITEGLVHPPPELGGKWVSADPDYGYSQPGNRRKVMLWSRSSWSSVDRVGSTPMPGGRLVSGTTPTSLGPVTFLGVCIPWRDAHVRTGRKDRSGWEDHLAYLIGLKGLLTRRRPQSPLVVLGDFNQRMPRRNAPRRVFQLLEEAMANLVWATAGAVPGLDRPVIDHLVHSPDLRAMKVQGLDSRDEMGNRLSDHPGIVIDMATEGVDSK